MSAENGQDQYYKAPVQSEADARLPEVAATLKTLTSLIGRLDSDLTDLNAKLLMWQAKRADADMSPVLARTGDEALTADANWSVLDPEGRRRMADSIIEPVVQEIALRQAKLDAAKLTYGTIVELTSDDSHNR